jgi:hypothetical protein
MTRSTPVRLRWITVCGVLAWLPSQVLLSARSLEYQEKQGPASQLGAIHFEPKAATDGLTADDFRFSSEIWESNDGVGIFLRRQYCGSPKNAELAIRQRAKSASRVFENRILRNKNGTRVGRRMVVSFGGEGTQRPQMILWTNRDMFYSVESSSFQHALLFEKRFPGL